MRPFVATLLAALCAGMALAAPPFDVFPETRSPNGRLAIAWGIPGKALDSKKLRSEEDPNEYLEEVLRDAQKAENYLVDLKSGKTVARLAGFKGFYRENHGSVSARWSRAGDVALVAHHGRWEPRALALVASSGAQADLRLRLNGDVRRYLARRGGKGYAAVKNKLALEVNDAAFLPGKVTLTVTASVPKEEEGYSATLWAVYHYRVRGGELEIRRSHVLPPGAKK